MADQLLELRRCPHCAIAVPRLNKVWASVGPTQRTDGGLSYYWGAFQCSSCGGVVAARTRRLQNVPENLVEDIYPGQVVAHEDLPEPTRTFLQQAYETIHAPDAATVMAASAIDAMLKVKGYDAGSLYARIDQAVKDNILTQGMANWAHAVRLEANGVRHADKEKPHASPEDAKQAVEFAEALGNFLFVLTAKIDRGIEAAKAT